MKKKLTEFGLRPRTGLANPTCKNLNMFRGFLQLQDFCSRFISRSLSLYEESLYISSFLLEKEALMIWRLILCDYVNIIISFLAYHLFQLS